MRQRRGNGPVGVDRRSGGELCDEVGHHFEAKAALEGGEVGSFGGELGELLVDGGEVADLSLGRSEVECARNLV